MSAVRKRGFSLLEVLAVVLILGTLGLAAVISLRPAGALCVDSASQVVGEALRFARSEARRHGEPRAFRVLPAAGSIEVFEPDPAAATTAFGASVNDPLTKRAYQVDLRDLPGCARIAIADTPPPFAYTGLAGQRTSVAFDERGEPYLLDSGVRRALSSGQVDLQLDEESRAIQLSSIGRVTLP